MRALWLILMLGMGCAAHAADFRPFTVDSRAVIEREYVGRPLVMAFWSLDCAYCAEELRDLGLLAAQQPRLALVLVNTDPTEAATTAHAMLDKLLGRARAARWQFAASSAEHLYFAVDRKWRGELPRAYFYNGRGGVETVSGRATPEWLFNWVRGLPTPVR